ncbi:hypothetical protein P8C59_000883 [Phyllachora maydis]|uniref:Reverse transcriptase Ty1/copia-type domain-containing protein n=1 Tax=Phyllachora maydis TaxID=1825666 RepID=A0AAD9HYK7_9PEZI|nr:hypothetical protein P8C59_000883 [Phyllachora maydis]
MADQAKGKEDKEDGEDYSKVIEVPKHISVIKNISSTLASLTNSSNATATGKTSYSPRFNPFSGTMALDSPPCPSRKEPYLGPAVNSATSNLDPPIDIGSKEGFKDTITSSIVKELSKKAYTIPDDSKLSGESNFEQWIQALSIVLRALGISNFLENPDISNTYSDSDQAVLLMLLRDSLSSSPRAAISRPIESKKEDVYNEFYALTFSTYRKGLSAFNAEFNGYLAKLTMAKIDIDPSLILNQQARMLGLTASSLNIEYLMADILEESRNPAIEAYRAAYVANSSNSTPNSNSNPSKKGKNKKKGKKKASYNVEGQNYSAKSAEQASFMLGSYNLAIEEEEESNSSSNSRYKKRKDFKGKGLKTSSNNKAKYKDNQPRRRFRDPALYNSWLYNTGSLDHISNSKERFTTFTPNTGQLRPINTGNSPVSLASIGSITLEVLSRKAPPFYTKLVLDNVLYLPKIDINIVSRVRHYNSGGCLIKETLYRGDRRYIAVLDFKKSGFFLNVKGSSKPILYTNFAFPLGLSSYTTKSIELQRNKIVVEIPSNSIRKEDYGPIIEDAIVSEAIEPNKRYKLRNSPAKGTTLEGIGPSLRGKRPYRPTREPKPLTGTGDLPCVLREPVIEGNKVVEKAISSPTLKEPNIGQRDYYNLLNLAKLCPLRAINKASKRLGYSFLTYLTTATTATTTTTTTTSAANPATTITATRSSDISFDSPFKGLSSKGELVDLDLNLEGAVSLDPSNLNTEKPISIEIGPSKLESYESSSDSKLDEPLPDKPINPVIVESTRPTISIRKPELPEADLILEGDKMQLDYYKLLAKTSSYILSFVYKARKRVISKDKLGVFKFLPRSLLPSNRKLITCRNVLKVKKDAKNRPIKYKSRLVARGFIQKIEQANFIGAFLNSTLREEIYIEIPEGLLDLAASNKAIYKLLLKYGYNPSTPNIIKLSKALYSLKQSPREWQDKLKILLKSLGYLPLISDPGVFYNTKTCHFIVTYIDDCLFIGPNIGYITDLKKRLNKVYAIEDLGPAAYFLGVQIIRDRPNRRLWLNQVDISFTVQWLSRSLNRPTKSHLNAAKNLFKYLNSTKDYSICFSYNGNTVADLGPKLSNSSNITTKLSRDFHSKEGPRPLTTTSTTIVDSKNSKGSSRTSTINSSLVPIGFSDSDFTGDKATSKSTYAYLYKLAGRPISWKTKRATTIALSTLEAKTNGLTEAIREVQ